MPKSTFTIICKKDMRIDIDHVTLEKYKRINVVEVLDIACNAITDKQLPLK